jgi:hypothetical protein
MFYAIRLERTVTSIRLAYSRESGDGRTIDRSLLFRPHRESPHPLQMMP